MHVIWLDAPELISHPVVVSLVVAIKAPMLSSVSETDSFSAAGLAT